MSDVLRLIYFDHLKAYVTPETAFLTVAESSEVWTRFALPETAFSFATQCEEKVHKQDGSDMPNANPNANFTQRDHILSFTLGLTLGWLGLLEAF